MLSRQWIDPRLGANVATRRMAIEGQIWSPKITNVNGRRDLKDDDTAFWRGYGDGEVLLSEKVRILLGCSLNFKNFPFDSQLCQLKFGSCKFLCTVIKCVDFVFLTEFT